MVNEKCVLVLETTLSAEDLFLNADSDLICLQTCLLFVFQVKSSAITQTYLTAAKSRILYYANLCLWEHLFFAARSISFQYYAPE